MYNYYMECPNCHFKLDGNEYFCPNCGKKLKSRVLDTSSAKQLQMYILSLIFVPLGFWWGYKYLKQPDKKSKVVGIVCVVITTVALVIVYKLLKDSISTLNEQISGLDPYKIPGF